MTRVDDEKAAYGMLITDRRAANKLNALIPV
jgi:hypothetical protein